MIGEIRMADKVGVTGTRLGLTYTQMLIAEKLLKPFKALVYGDCTGADAGCFYKAKELGLVTICYPPTNPKYRAFTEADRIYPEQPYALRNHSIVLTSSELIAFPKGREEGEGKGGTWITVRMARQMGKKITIVFSDGMMKIEEARR